MKRLNHERYDEKVLKDYDAEIKKMKMDNMIKEGSLLNKEEWYKIYNIKEKTIPKKDIVIGIPDDVFVGYCAGFFDGEGSVHIDKNYILHISVFQTNHDILKMICNRYGGKTSKLKPRKLESGKGYKKDAWYWGTISDNSIPFLISIKQYSLEKRPQIELAIEYQTKIKTRHQGSGYDLSLDEIKIREYYRKKLREMKKQSEEDIEDFGTVEYVSSNDGKNQKSLSDY